jgi:hypothetical protein
MQQWARRQQYNKINCCNGNATISSLGFISEVHMLMSKIKKNISSSPCKGLDKFRPVLRKLAIHSYKILAKSPIRNILRHKFQSTLQINNKFIANNKLTLCLL